jgi:hypothetical protein
VGIFYKLEISKVCIGGYYINTSSLPEGSGWVTYLSYVKWSFQVNI